jgi:hypothetical protein
MVGIGKEKETLNLNMVDVLTVEEQTSNLKLAEATMGKGPGSSQEFQ